MVTDIPRRMSHIQFELRLGLFCTGKTQKEGGNLLRKGEISSTCMIYCKLVPPIKKVFSDCCLPQTNDSEFPGGETINTTK
jgi:hypothetical protein